MFPSIDFCGLTPKYYTYYITINNKIEHYKITYKVAN